MSEQPTLRSAPAIQKAHDTLLTVLMNPELRAAVCGSESSLLGVRAAANALCWCLQHEHNQQFAASLAWIEAVLKMHGLEMVDSGELHTRVQ